MRGSDSHFGRFAFIVLADPQLEDIEDVILSASRLLGRQPTPSPQHLASMSLALSRMRIVHLVYRLPLARRIGSPYCTIGNFIFPRA